MNYVLDTDICIYWLNGNKRIRDKIMRIGTDSLRTTIITVAELRYGAYNSQKVEENLININKFLRKVRIIGLGKRAAERFGEIKAELRKKGELIGDFDIAIASITLNHKGILITNNIEHFKRIAGLHCENWLI